MSSPTELDSLPAGLAVMAKRRLRLHFSLRVLALVVLLCALPCWWAANKIRQHRNELAAVERIRMRAPSVYADYQYCGPDWMWRIGFRPNWLQRVRDIDVTGMTEPSWKFDPSAPTSNFNDADLAAIHNDLLVFEQLDELYFPLTQLTDASLPALDDFKNVRFINLQQTQMTSAAVREFDIQHPQVKIAFFYDSSTPDGDPNDRNRPR